jgi:hypothetical protein
MSDGADRDIPDSCRAAASDPPGRRSCRRRPRSGARAAAESGSGRPRGLPRGAASGRLTQKTMARAKRTTAARKRRRHQRALRGGCLRCDRRDQRGPSTGAIQASSRSAVPRIVIGSLSTAFHSSSRLVADQHPPGCARDRIETEAGFVRQAREARTRTAQGAGQARIRDRRQMLPQEDLIGGLRTSSMSTVHKAGTSIMAITDKVQNHAGESSVQPSSRSDSHAPPARGCAADCRSASIATGPTADCPAAGRAGAVAAAVPRRLARYSPQEPAGELPVAADPALAAADVGAVVGGVVLVQMDVAEERRTGVAAFEQVVAEDPVLRESGRRGPARRRRCRRCPCR